MNVFFRCTLLIVSLLYIQKGLAEEASVEVLHSWKEPGDINALNLLITDMRNDGYGWDVTKAYEQDDFETLNSRVFNGNAPAAVEINDLDYKQWGRLGFLANLNSIASTKDWNQIIPEQVAEVSKYNNKYVSVPVSIHRTNWLWINKSMIARFNLKAPKTWKEFDTVAEYLLNRGHPVFALEKDEKSKALLLESLVLSIGGADLYRDIFVEHSIPAYKTNEFKAAIVRFYKLLDLAEKSKAKVKSTSYNFIPGDVAFVFGGDWLSKKTSTDGKQFLDRYSCTNLPGLKDQFVFTSEGFVFFNLPNIHEKVVAQTVLAEKLMGSEFQKSLNQSRGSIPVRTDLSIASADQCSQKAYRDIAIAAAKDMLVPSAAFGMATSASVANNFVLESNALAESPLSVDESAKEISRHIRLGNYLMSK